MMREAIERQIGMLTCQVIDLNVRLSAAQQEMGRQSQAIAERDAEIVLLKAAAPTA
jgi:hypothetical protein